MKRANVYAILGIISATLGFFALVTGALSAYRGDTLDAILRLVFALLFERDFRMRERQLEKIRTKLEREVRAATGVPALSELLTQAANRLDTSIGNEDLIVPMRKIAIALREDGVA